MENGLSRRAFLGGAAFAGIAGMGALSACAPQRRGGEALSQTSGGEAGIAGASWRDAPAKIGDDEISETRDCEVLVIGLGHAGCCAMKAAVEAGAKVCAMQETSEDALLFKGHSYGHINSEFLKSRGVPEVDVTEFFNDWQVRSNNRSNPGLIMRYITHVGETFDWLIEGLTDEEKQSIYICYLMEGIPFKREFSGVKTWIGTARLTTELVDKMYRGIIGDAAAGGADVLWETKGCQLVTDEAGKVVGAIGLGPNGYVKVNASKGVILTTGGFGSNEEMREDLLYEIKESMGEQDQISCNLDCDGSGIQMGYWAGGRLDPCMGTMDGAYWYPTDSPIDPIGATSSLWMNADGKRYCNEGFGSTELQAMPGAKQPDGVTCSVFDSNVEELIKAQAFGHMSYDYAEKGFDGLHETMEKAYAGGEQGSADGDEAENTAGADKALMSPPTLYAADDYETLGKYLGYAGQSLENFVATIERYNELCEKGLDEDFGKDASLLFPIKTPPFYGFAGTKALGVLMVTVGGLLVDENGAVLGRDYRPIPGLFAAGNASGGRFGWQYSTSIGGESLTTANTLGRLTAEYVASL